MDKPKRMDMRAPGNVSETCLAEYQTQPAAYKPNRFIYLKAGHISTSHLDTLVYNNNSVHCILNPSMSLVIYVSTTACENSQKHNIIVKSMLFSVPEAP